MELVVYSPFDRKVRTIFWSASSSRRSKKKLNASQFKIWRSQHNELFYATTQKVDRAMRRRKKGNDTKNISRF